MKLDYLVMCSKCEVRMHPDDYKKHKKHCNPLVEYIPYPVTLPWSAPAPYPTYPYPVWITTVGDTIPADTITVSGGTTTSVTAYLAGVTPTNALSS